MRVKTGLKGQIWTWNELDPAIDQLAEHLTP